MNTEQSYVGKGNYATTLPQMGQNTAKTSSQADNRLTKTPDILFEPSYINVPIYLVIDGRDEAKDCFGASQLDVLISALGVYEEKVRTFTDGEDKETILLLIDEMRETILDAAYTRLSECASILHKLKYFSGCNEIQNLKEEVSHE